MRYARCRGYQLQIKSEKQMSKHERPHVLVVEDNSKIAQMIALALEMNGCRPSLAANGLEALNLIRSDASIAAIVLDLLMPEMDGLTFLHHLRAEPDNAQIPVIIASAIAPPPEIQVEAVLRKPLDLNALWSAVEKVLSRGSSSG
jgi:CheY-like chemotaxis protein